MESSTSDSDMRRWRTIYYIIGKATVTFSRPRSYTAAGSFLGCLGTRKIIDVILVILGLNRLHKIVYPSGFDDGRTPGCSLSTLGLQSQSIKLNTQSPLGNQRGSGDESMTPIPMEPSLSATKKGVHLGTPHLESPTFSRPSMYFHRLWLLIVEPYYYFLDFGGTKCKFWNGVKLSSTGSISQRS